MSRSHLRFGIAIPVVVAGVFALTAGLVGQAPEPGQGYPVADWPLAGGNTSSSRYTTLDQIAPDTIDRLGGAWVAEFPGGVSSRATPVVQDGVIYMPGGANVFALDARSGEPIWRWQAEDPASQRVPSWQGVGLGDGHVFIGLRSAEVAALDQETGELVWATPVGSVPQAEGETVTTAPIYARGKVFVGLANGDSGGQGRVPRPRCAHRRSPLDLLRGAPPRRGRP